ncbi:MAG: hypothetical protein JOZ20_07180 [Sphingomonas sp.]|nr:hypothetical protein [Sphingomonas sp.]MBW0008227.1 hypothetical protein [Sphingomonas sp.]
MRYFGSKRVEQLDEDAYAAERLMAIAGRFKTASPDQPAEAPVDSEEAPKAQDKPN